MRVVYRRGGRAVEAVRGVSLSLERGIRLGIVGASGCGKSSLVKALLGLVPLAAGTVTFDGQSVHGAKRALRRRFQPVFQSGGASLDPRMTVGALLEEPFEIHGLECGQRADDLLTQVQLPLDLKGRRPHELSSGQRQRVAIARALALDPELLILDEPVSALDVSVQAQVLSVLEAEAARRSLTLLFVSHDVSAVGAFCSQLAVMHQGLLVETGPTSEILSSPRHPAAQHLLSAALSPLASGSPCSG